MFANYLKTVTFRKIVLFVNIVLDKDYKGPLYDNLHSTFFTPHGKYKISDPIYVEEKPRCIFLRCCIKLPCLTRSLSR